VSTSIIPGPRSVRSRPAWSKEEDCMLNKQTHHSGAALFLKV
jgi:hypothetical protein